MLLNQFNKTIKNQLWQDLGKPNINSVPILKKVVLNYRVKDAASNKESLQNAITEIMAISGQKPGIASAKKSEASFKIRKGDPLALKVTLRGEGMYAFIEKLFNLVLPRLRDFKGLSQTAFDDQGNYNLTIKDQTYFPEIDLNKVNQIRSLQVTLVTSTSSKSSSKMLLSALGLPFEK
jgi:large subunit ribosomal protein L5